MGNPFDYGQSVLKGYLARQELDQRASQLAQEHQQAQDLLQYHYKALDEAAKQHKETLDFEKFKVKDALRKSYGDLMGYQGNPNAPVSSLGQPQSQEQNYLPNLPQDAQGQTQGQALPGIGQDKPWEYSTPEMQQAGLGSVTIDPNTHENLMRLGLVQAGIEGAKKKAESEAALPSQLSLQKQKATDQISLQTEKDKTAWQRLIEGNASKEDINALNRASAEKIGAGHDYARLLAAKMKDSELTEQSLMGNVISAATGQSKLGQNKQDLATKNIMAKMGWSQLDPKMSAALNSSQHIEDALDIADNYANTLSTNRLANKIGSHVPGVNDNQRRAFNEMDSIQLGATKELNDYAQRLNIPELKATKSGFPGEWDSPDSAKQKVLDMRDRVWKSKWNVAMGGLPEEQKLFNLQHQNGGLDQFIQRYENKQINNPYYDSKDPNSRKTIPIVGKKKSDGTYQVWNPNTKKYIPLTEVKINQPTSQSSSSTDENEPEEE